MSIVYCKTDAGRDEISNRTLKLPAALRSLLVMIDGQRSSTELGEIIASLRLPGDALEQLSGLGLIEVRGEMAEAASAKPKSAAATAPAAMVSTDEAERYKMAYALASEAIGKHLGFKSYFMQIKLERCSTLADLEKLAPEIATALTKAKSDGLAKRFISEIRGLEPG